MIRFFIQIHYPEEGGKPSKYRGEILMQNINKGPFLFDFCHLQCKKLIEIMDHLKDI